MRDPNNPIIPHDSPSTLNFFFTGQCNLDCKYCFLKKTDFKHSPDDEESLKRSIDLLFSYPGKHKTLSFNGSEPTLEIGLLRALCDYARKKAQENKTRLDVAIISNGTLLDKDILRSIAKEDTIIKISIDGDKLTHDENRPFRNNPDRSSFDAIMRNMERLGTTFRLSAAMVFTPQNVSRLLDNIRFLSAKDFYSIEFYPDQYAHWNTNDLRSMERSFEDFERYYIELFQRNAPVFKNAFLDTLVNGIEVDKMERCGKLSFGNDQQFYVCDKVFSLDPAMRKDYAIGNACEGIDDDKRLRLLKKLRDEFTAESGLECSECSIYKYCFCPIGHLLYTKTFETERAVQSRRLYTAFCCISKIYVRTFLKIKSALKYDPRFIQLYQY
ncbi:MAG TPA: radical SAM protein [Candidatus Omnitrophota bacterium]|nr:radical SAM protein [Candidatus Omnitrophota bacterium]